MLSYSQNVKKKLAPPAYTDEWEGWITKYGLDMDLWKGEEYVCEESRKVYSELQKITLTTIQPSLLPESQERSFLEVLNRCQTRNEAMVNRDVTMLLVPPIIYLYLHGANHLEHVIDEVNADWDERCVLAGPRPRPDLAIGLFSSAFTSEEIDKLDNYTTVDNWTRFTVEMYFPFLTFQVQCGNESLDIADRRNMHSCSTALKALLRIEQEADTYRPEKKLASLDGQILVFSVSHDQKDARLYGHYARVQGEKWTYHRLFINYYNLFPKRGGILALHNFIQNIFKDFLPIHVQRLKDALAAFPEPGVLSSAPTGVTDDSSQQTPQHRSADGFLIPGAPASASRSEEAVSNQQSDFLVQQQQIQFEQQMEESARRFEQQMKESARRFEQRMKESRERGERSSRESKERGEKMQKQLDDIKKFIISKITTM